MGTGTHPQPPRSRRFAQRLHPDDWHVYGTAPHRTAPHCTILWVNLIRIHWIPPDSRPLIHAPCRPELGVALDRNDGDDAKLQEDIDAKAMDEKIMSPTAVENSNWAGGSGSGSGRGGGGSGGGGGFQFGAKENAAATKADHIRLHYNLTDENVGGGAAGGGGGGGGSAAAAAAEESDSDSDLSF